MIMKMRSILMVLVALGIASEANAQWQEPTFLPPRPGDDIGIYLSDIADFGIQGIWRQQGNLNLGLRLGYIDTAGDGIVTVGVETWDLLVDAGPDFPLDVAWTLGAGAGFNGGTVIQIPVGLTIGRTLPLETVAFQIYGHPRLGLFIYPDAPEGVDELELEGLFDLGVDALLNENIKLRFGATFGEIDAVGIGIAFNWSRGAVVR
jgi:hypothetical protein